MTTSKAKILCYDIETSDLTADIGHIISIGWMFVGEKTAKVIDITQFPGKTVVDDSNLIREFLKVYETADAEVGHFSEYFDRAFIKTKMLIHGMQPPSKVTLIDTWRIMKKRLKFSSNRLARLIESLDCPFKKTPVDMKVWALARCGDKKSIQYVRDHNKWDVLSTEWCYKKLAPYWDQHPAIYHPGDPTRVCVGCGSARVTAKGRYFSKTHAFQRMRCGPCGRTWNGKKLPPEEV